MKNVYWLCAIALVVGAQAHSSDFRVGDPVPRFTASSLLNDQAISLGEHLGKVVYVDFWASWCRPCLDSFPFMEELIEEFGRNGLVIVAINIDDVPERGETFIDDHMAGKVSFYVASDPLGRVAEQFDLRTLPTSFLVDRDGRLRYRHVGFRKRSAPTALRQKVAALIAE